MAIITSALDTDQYKLTMLQAFYHQTPAAMGSYKFVNRTKNVNLANYVKRINAELDEFCETVRFTNDELTWMSKKPYFKTDFLDYLSMFRFNRDHIKVSAKDNGEIDIIATGPITRVMAYEIPVLAIVNEVYFEQFQNDEVFAEGKKRLMQKVDLLKSYPKDFKFADFGTRRRFSRQWQEYVVKSFIDNKVEAFSGTSNMDLARRYNITAIGTMAHEWIQSFQAMGPRLVDSQKASLEAWVKEYRGDLGIALTDTAGMDAFLRDFDLYFAKLFDGLRHDSGDPIVWANKAIEKYKSLKIDPATKSLVFSDGLDVPRSYEIYQQLSGQAKLFFGIGTNLTNDLGPKALNIVMKLMECNGQPTAKISDTSGKTLCENPEFLAYFKQVFQIKN